MGYVQDEDIMAVTKTAEVKSEVGDIELEDEW